MSRRQDTSSVLCTACGATVDNPECRCIDGECMYRLDMTPECPVRCAVGLFIPDEEYSSRMESLSVVELGKVLDFPEELIGFLRDLQRAHDLSTKGLDAVSLRQTFYWRMGAALKRIAEQYGLRYTEG